MLEKLQSEFLEAWNQLAPPAPITLLLSGGGDSVALFHLLRQARVDFQVLHFVHDGDPNFAKQSEAFCRELCSEHSVVFESVALNGKALAAEGDLSWEAACRQLRYENLKTRTGSFLTAHTADDQIETVVMRVLDGSGLAGIGGIRSHRADGVYRPLLRIRGAQLRRFLEQAGWKFVNDPSNQDGNRRARVRHKILPLLHDFQPALASVLDRSTKRWQEDEDFLREALESWMNSNTGEGGDNWSSQALSKLHPSLLYRFLRKVWSRMSPRSRRPLGSLFEECKRVLPQGRNEAEILFPGGWALVVLGQKVWLRPKLPPQEWSFSFDQEQPSETRSFLKSAKAPTDEAIAWPWCEGTVIRSRRAGDRFQGKSIKKLLASTGQPPWVRDRWPLLAKDGQVIAVWGKSKPRTGSGQCIWLKFEANSLRA